MAAATDGAGVLFSKIGRGRALTRKREIQFMSSVIVEFYGIPRHRAKRSSLNVNAVSVAQLLDAVERACPNLRGALRIGNRVSPHFLLSIDGVEFIDDLQLPLTDGSRVLLLSADAGG